jgi:hypothetical protein
MPVLAKAPPGIVRLVASDMGIVLRRMCQMLKVFGRVTGNAKPKPPRKATRQNFKGPWGRFTSLFALPQAAHGVNVAGDPDLLAKRTSGPVNPGAGLAEGVMD